MCGIAGRVNFDGRSVQPGDVQGMNDALAHRGPDGEGIYCHGNVGLAHRRLAIIDPHSGAQPFVNDDASIVLSFNGEIYNYVEIRQALAGRCHFRSHSDTEVLLRAYETWGIACVQQFRGMFAFALYDARSMMLYLVRDRLGIKPLYYYQAREHLLFASEFAALLRAGTVPRTLNPHGLAGFFRYQYVPTPATIYQDVRKLEPGHFLAIDVHRGAVQKQRYWQLAVHFADKSEQLWMDELNAALDDIMRIYVRSDVPFGAFLSGGVDSSLVTALMARQLPHPVQTFAIGFAEQQYSELPFAAAASHIMHTTHHAKMVSAQLALDILPCLVQHFGEPFGDSSAVPTYYVSHEAAQHVKMVLSGDGGDELFGGYDVYPLLLQEYGLAAGAPGHRSLAQLARTCLQVALVRRLAGALHRGIKHFGQPPGWAARVQRLAQPPLPPTALHEGYDLYRSVFSPAATRRLLRPELALRPDLSIAYEPPSGSSTLLDPVTWSEAQDVQTYLLDDILTKVDRASMANSLEVRVPLLDHTLVELAFTIPRQFKVRVQAATQRFETKVLLKQSAARFYPMDFLQRPKMGFGIPVATWLRTPFKGLLEEELQSPRHAVFDWVRFDVVQNILAQLRAGDDSCAPQIWCVLMFSLWMRQVHGAT